MTLEEYFGLSHPPFPRVATLASLMRTPVTDQIIERFRFALVRDTIALLIAESGGGKSTLLSLFAQSLDAANL